MSPFHLSIVPVERLNQLPDRARLELVDMLAALDRIRSSPPSKRRDIARAIAMENPGRQGWSASRLINKYYDVAKAGWEAALNKAVAGRMYWCVEDAALPPTFISYFQTLCERNQRCSSQAMKALYRQWRAWRAGQANASVPGYQEPPDPRPDTGLPEGWTARNLRRYSPTKREIVRARIGNSTAAELLPSVITTRAGLDVGEYYVIDDHEFNLKVNFVGQIKAMRPRMLGALDIRSGHVFARGFKPTLWDETEEKKRVLTERDTKWLVAHILCNIGYRPEGTVFVTEHGLAVIRKEFAARILSVTGGAVTVAKSGIIGVGQMPGQHEGKGGGNPRFKAHLESMWNAVDNIFADLGGQTGKDRDHAPEQLHGIDRENRQLLQAAAALPVDVTSQIRWTVLTWHEFLAAALDRFHALDHDHSHELEGWEECGHIAKEFRLTSEQSWLPVSDLAHIDDAKREIILSAAQMRARRWSRHEAWHSGARRLLRVPFALISDLLGPDFALKVKVRKMMIEIMDRELGPSPFHYIARFGDQIIEDGQQLTCFLNPHDPRQLVAYDERGRCLGCAEPWQRVCRSDAESVGRQIGLVRGIESQANRMQDARHAGFAAEHAEARRINAEILAGHSAATQIENEREKDEREHVRRHGAAAAADILSPSEPSPEPGQDTAGEDFLNMLKS